MESPTTARRISDLGVPERVMLTTRNSNARPTIVLRFRKFWRASLPPPLLAANSAVKRSSFSLVPLPGTAMSHTSSSSARRRPMSTSDSRESSAWRIVLDRNCTTPAPSVAVTTARALALFIKGSNVAPVRSRRAALAAAAAMMVWCGWW